MTIKVHMSPRQVRTTTTWTIDQGLAILALLVSVCPTKGQTTSDFLIADRGIVPSVAIFPSGEVGVSWANDVIYFRTFGASGNPTRDSIKISEATISDGPSISISQNKALIAWRLVSITFNSSIFGQLIDFDGARIGLTGVRPPCPLGSVTV